MSAPAAIVLALLLSPLAAFPASARDWTFVAGGLDPRDGTRYRGRYLVRPGGTVIFYGDSGFEPREGLFQWRSPGGIEQLATLPADTDFDGIAGLEVSDGLSEIADAGRGGVVVVRRTASAYCESQFASEAVIERIDEAGATTVLRPGSDAAGFAPGWILTGYVADGIVRGNQAGSIAFLGRAAFDDTCPFDRFAPLARFIYGPVGEGGLGPVAAEGESAPSAPSGIVTDFGIPHLTEANQVVFTANIETGGAFGSSFPAVLRWEPESGLSTLIRAGQEVDGVLVLPPVVSSDYPFAIGPAGHVAVAAPANDFNSEGLFVVAPDGSVALRHANGDPAPGLADHAFSWFAQLDPFFFSFRHQMKVNAQGEVAFVGTARTSGESPSVVGLWGPDESGALALKLRIGGDLPGRPGIAIENLELLGFSDDRRLLVRAGGSFVQSEYLLLDADGTAETLIGVGGGLWSVMSLRADPQLRSFAVDSFGALYASVPEPGDLASTIAAALALATLRRRA